MKLPDGLPGNGRLSGGCQRVGLRTALMTQWAGAFCDDGAMVDVRTVVVLPGRSFGAYAPQLFFPMMAAMRRGAEPVAVSWSSAEELDRLALEQIPSAAIRR
ncbi:MAG TPA: hypothetical protein VIP98_06565 [Microlunatus sp.]